MIPSVICTKQTSKASAKPKHLLISTAVVYFPSDSIFFQFNFESTVRLHKESENMSHRIRKLTSIERFVPDKPPTGQMRHMNAKEISRCDLLIPRQMDDKACRDETDELIRCWRANGHEVPDAQHPCYKLEFAFKRCVSMNVCLKQTDYIHACEICRIFFVI